MSFRDPAALGLLLLVPLAAFVFARAARRRAEAVRLFLGRVGADEAQRLRASARRRGARAALVTAALAALVVALAGPRLGTSVREARQRRLDLVVALDVSASMLAEDVAPSRLERAKFEIARLAEARPGDRLGLVVFAGDAFLQCPLTTDRGAFRLFLDAAGPDAIPTPGSDLGRALDAAARALEGASVEGEAPARAVLVVSDGEDHEGGLEAAALALRDQGVHLLAAGVGTEEGGPIPVRQAGRRVGYRTDRSGRQVVTRLEWGALRDVAGDDGLVRIGPGAGAAAALDARLDRVDRTVVTEQRVEAAAERFQWPLALGLLLLLAERVLALRPVRG